MRDERDSTSDAQLVTAALSAPAGSARDDAFRSLVRRHWKVVIAILESRSTGAREAEEITQEAFVRAWRHIDRLEDPRCFFGWLVRIARNIATDRARAQRRFERVDDADLANFGQPLGAARETDAVDVVEMRDEWHRVKKALERLPDKYRDVLTLRYLREMSNQEIARSLGEPEGTIRNRIFRALNRMRGELREPQHDRTDAFDE